MSGCAKRMIPICRIVGCGAGITLYFCVWCHTRLVYLRNAISNGHRRRQEAMRGFLINFEKMEYEMIRKGRRMPCGDFAPIWVTSCVHVRTYGLRTKRPIVRHVRLSIRPLHPSSARPSVWLYFSIQKALARLHSTGSDSTRKDLCILR